MKVEIEIPRGKYCGDCQLLGATKNKAEYECNLCFGMLTYEEGDYNHDNPVKHTDCPGLMEVK